MCRDVAQLPKFQVWYQIISLMHLLQCFMRYDRAAICHSAQHIFFYLLQPVPKENTLRRKLPEEPAENAGKPPLKLKGCRCLSIGLATQCNDKLCLCLTFLKRILNKQKKNSVTHFRNNQDLLHKYQRIYTYSMLLVRSSEYEKKDEYQYHHSHDRKKSLIEYLLHINNRKGCFSRLYFCHFCHVQHEFVHLIVFNVAYKVRIYIPFGYTVGSHNGMNNVTIPVLSPYIVHREL